MTVTVDDVLTALEQSVRSHLPTILTRLATLWFAVVLGLGCLAVARRRIAARPRAPAA